MRPKHNEPWCKALTLVQAPFAEDVEPGNKSMRVVLEVRSGPAAGKKVWLRHGQILEVGRTERSEFVVPQDGQISSRHFALECDNQACRVRDLDSSNGTLLNGKKIAEAFVRDGDQIVAGQTTFVVRIEGVTPAVEASPPVGQAVLTSDSPPVAQASGQGPLLVTASPLAASPARRSTVIPTASTKRFAVPSPYDLGFADDDPAVRREALLAAAWTRQRWLLDYCRSLAQSPAPENWDAIMLLAILGRPSDLEQILAVGKTVQLGPKRYQVMGVFGHPAVVDTLLRRIESQDPLTAPAAGVAFTKITGAEIDSEKMATIPPEKESEPDEPEIEPMEVILPSPALAKDHWNKVKAQYSRGTRWCRGFNLSRGASEEVLAQLDMESRWETCLRGKFEGTWTGSLMDLETFPQSRR